MLEPPFVHFYLIFWSISLCFLLVADMRLQIRFIIWIFRHHDNLHQNKKHQPFWQRIGANVFPSKVCDLETDTWIGFRKQKSSFLFTIFLLMKISEHFSLSLSPGERLPFLDVHVDKDNPIYLDPNRAIVSWPMFEAFVENMWTFREKTLDLLENPKKEAELQQLRSHLWEPNETCLWISKWLPKGKWIGEEKSLWLLEEVKKSKARKTKLLEDLQDTNLFIDWVWPDNISDMATNIVRKNLIDFTIQQCQALWIKQIREFNQTIRDWSKRKIGRYILPFNKNTWKALLFVPIELWSTANRFWNAWLYRHHILELDIKNYSLYSNLISHRKDWETYIKKWDVIDYHKKHEFIGKGRKEIVLEKSIQYQKKWIMRSYKKDWLDELEKQKKKYWGDPQVIWQWF